MFLFKTKYFWAYSELLKKIYVKIKNMRRNSYKKNIMTALKYLIKNYNFSV